MNHILSIVLFTPLVGLLLLLFIPSSNARAIKWFANAASFVGFLVSLPLVFNFDRTKDFQFVEKAPWIPTLGATYHIGIDGLGLLLVMLTTLLGFIAILASWNAITERLKEYYCFFLLLQTAMLGVFMALDFLLFFIFWETVLVPMYFIIAIWGGPRRVYAAMKFIIYTLIGSVLMFLGILTLYFQHYMQFQVYSFDIFDLMRTQVSAGVQWWVFWAFFAGFAVKVPMFPFHTWLPDAHVEAPTAGSVILASVLLKMGTYGFLRFSVPLLPDAAKDHTIVTVMAVLSIIGIVYGALACLMQKDWKKLVAYSSVSHLGFCTLGIFALNPAGKAQKEGYKLDRSVAMREPEKTHEHLKWINIITSNLKRYLLSTHHGVFPKYRKVFLAEFAYRFNRRYWPNQAFDRLLYACIYANPAPLPVLRA